MERLDPLISALADPTRRAILARLARGEATAGELLKPFPISQPALSHHLKVLEGAGLILRGRDGTRRPCRLAPGAFAPLDAWLSGLRDALKASYDRLDALLAEEDAPPSPPAPGDDP